AADFHDPSAGPGPGLVLGMAGEAAAGLSGPGGARPAAAAGRRRQCAGAAASCRRRCPPPAAVAPRRQPPRDRLETFGPARQPAGPRIRGTPGRGRGARLGRTVRPAPRGAHPAPGPVGGRSRARPAALPPGVARAGADRARRRPRPSPCLPARAGAAAGRRGSLMARRRTPSPPLDEPGKRWTLAAAGACLLPLLLQLPGHVALGVGGLGLVGAVVSLRVNLPAWPRPLLALALFGLVLANYGFHLGRDTGCALLAAMLAIKPMELRNLRDARSLLGFALFAPFATFLLDQGPLSLLLGLVGVVLALMAMLRISELESNDRGPGSAAAPEANASGAWRRLRTVGRLVAVGLPLALAAFWLFPRMASPMWGVPDRAVARPGLSDTMSPGEWLDLMSDDSPAARVQFSGPEPRASEMYWRGPVLLDFDGRTCKSTGWLASRPPAEVARGEPVWDYEIEIEPTDRRHVVALDLPLAAPDDVRMSRDLSMTAPRPLSQLQRFRIR